MLQLGIKLSQLLSAQNAVMCPWANRQLSELWDLIAFRCKFEWLLTNWSRSIYSGNGDFKKKCVKKETRRVSVKPFKLFW